MFIEKEKHIWLIEGEGEEYFNGWYFSDELEQYNGPFGTIEEARQNLKLYCDELNKQSEINEIK
jgi:hypothetical protein